MIEFLQIVFSFPTAFYSVLLGVVVGYWLLSALGLVGMDVADGLFGHGHFGGDAHGHGPAHGHTLGDQSLADGAHHHQSVFDPLMRLGLGGIPVTVVLSVLVATAWALTYLADLYLLRLLPGGSLRFIADLVALVVAFVLAIPVAAFALRPVRRLLRKMQPEPPRPLLGQTAVIRSPAVTRVTGTAAIEDGGAGLILQIRDEGGERFKRGDRVVLIEYLADQNAYRVVSEDEFRGA
ncbi:hypothetical protein [Lysobacter sp. CA196]|uniref:hypothetical protein n=1 Tax=Lysobacter sp. CA196 TaxID=3455606 RepID=UPI003F8D82B0